MKTFAEALGTLATATDGAVATRRGHEAHCSVGADNLPRFAAVVSRDLGADLVLVTAEDRRRSADAFFVHYLFAHAGANWFVHASVRLDADGPTLPSLRMKAMKVVRVKARKVLMAANVRRQSRESRWSRTIRASSRPTMVPGQAPSAERGVAALASEPGVRVHAVDAITTRLWVVAQATCPPTAFSRLPIMSCVP
jgi:hypothetical protein